MAKTFNPGDRVRFVGSHYPTDLTVGKVYTVTQAGSGCVRVVHDQGQAYDCPISYFELAGSEYHPAWASAPAVLVQDRPGDPRPFLWLVCGDLLVRADAYSDDDDQPAGLLDARPVEVMAGLWAGMHVVPIGQELVDALLGVQR